MIKEGLLKSPRWNGLLAGSVVALALSIFTAQHFKPGLLTLPWLVVWYGVSLLFGGAAGFAGGFLANRMPVRAASAVAYAAGAAFGALGFLLQLYLFLSYMFRNSPTSF